MFEVSTLEQVALAGVVANAGAKAVILAQLQFAPEPLEVSTVPLTKKGKPVDFVLTAQRTAI
ncbi:hypothetical protein [Massilia sp. 9096]|uniref:hypothetical protein n=1 Tax=Massilia sp. 9096 TaxID=1500894 RepID=UPI001EFA87BC|nr:hypothetical protein [Massilia sp. 9096]